jgi:hypothetical protein
MNFQEGMRRIGLTVGVLGALSAALAGLWSLSDLADQRKAQAEFDSLLNLPIVKIVTKDIAKQKFANAFLDIQNHPRGIKQVWVNEKSEIASFEMDDGRTITNRNAPSPFWYLLFPLIVAVGFLAPWGSVRLVTWIVSGFIVSRQP